MTTEAGTYIYSAPEIFDGHYNNKIDVYCYGLIINELFTRQPPFIGVPYLQMIEIKKNGTFEIDQNMPEYLQKIVTKCLDPDPDKRPSFKDIFQKLLSKVYSQENCAPINKFLQYVKVGKKQKQIWKIPQQILRIPSDDFKWDSNTSDPIDWDAFKKILKPDIDKKILLIMTIGTFEVGKSTFLRTITGNQGLCSGKGLKTTTMGILMDGPYSKNDLINQIYNSDYQRKFANMSIDNETQIYFLDSQGIGDQEYKNFEIILDKINSIFCSVSSICISVEKANVIDNSLQSVLKIIRRVQFTGFTKTFLLIRGYQNFDVLTNISFESLENYQRGFSQEFIESKSEATKYYAYSHLTPLPLGDLQSNYDCYLRSCWFSVYFILSDVTELSLMKKNELIQKIQINISYLFGGKFQTLKKLLIDNPPKSVHDMFPKPDNESQNIFKICYSADYFIADRVIDIIDKSKNEENNDNEIIDKIKAEIYLLSNIYLPYFIGEYNCPLRDFYQYRYEISCDIESYMKKNSKVWLNYIKSDRQSEKKKKLIEKEFDKCSKYRFVPFANIYFIAKGISLLPVMYDLIFSQIIERENLKKIFNITIYPFIWDRELKNSSYSYDLSKISQIGFSNDQLIVFYEQIGENDSSIIFRSLTGYDVNFAKQTTVSELFFNADVNRMMKRYMRNGKIHQSKFGNKCLNILYLKGCTKKHIEILCKTQKNKPIFISSCLLDQSISISPEDSFEFYLFLISDSTFQNYLITKKTYLEEVEYINNKVHVSHAKILPIYWNKYNFENSGPFTQATIKYGCRYVLKDESLV